MCLIVIAHRVSPHFPLVIAANRDEEYARPTIAPQFWSDAPGVFGGRDALMGGSWLAISREGRFAAVTNLRGAMRKTRSRGELVRDFVTGEASPRDYAEALAGAADGYAGFHLLAGIAGDEVAYVTPESFQVLSAGVHAVSNAPAGEEWPKMALALSAMQELVEESDAAVVTDRLLEFLTAPRNSGAIESEPFVAGERYGTRSSTAILVSSRSIEFAERNFGPHGSPVGDVRRFRILR